MLKKVFSVVRSLLEIVEYACTQNGEDSLRYTREWMEELVKRPKSAEEEVLTSYMNRLNARLLCTDPSHHKLTTYRDVFGVENAAASLGSRNGSQRVYEQAV